MIENKIIKHDNDKLIKHKSYINNLEKPKFRNSNIELLRFILSILVIFWHFSRFIWINPILVTPVNTFAIISGYFLIKNNDEFRFFKFLPTIFFLYIVNILLTCFFSFIFHFENKINWTELLLYGNGGWWFLWGILIIYLLSPILNYGIKLVNKYVLFTIITILWLIFQINGYVPTTYQISTYYYGSIIILLYGYLLGAFLQLHCKNYFKKIILVRLVALIILVFGFVFSTLFLILNSKNNLLFLVYDNNSIFVLPLAFAIFTFFITINIKYNKFINFLGKLSIFVFAYHIFFGNNLIYILGINNIGFILLFSIIWSIICYWPYKYFLNWFFDFKFWKKIETKFKQK